METKRKIRWGRNNKNVGTASNPNYKRWAHMRNRCYLKDNPEYNRYGKKGIRVFDEWLADFDSYDSYIMSLPNALKETYTIDRIDPEGNYEPGNLRWASKQVQSRNCRLSSNNKSGTTGVIWHKAAEKWRAYIMVNRKQINLGLYEDLEEAVKARKSAEVKYKFKE